MTRTSLRWLDEGFCRALLAIGGDAPGILSFLFHAVAADGGEGEIDEVVDPTQTLSVSSLEAFIRYFRGHGYRFVSPAEIEQRLEPTGRYVLMTFDDGYYNNLRVAPVLRREGVPAVFFISTNYVAEGRAFWWDVVHRERRRRGVSSKRILEEQLALKAARHDQIERYLIEHFGPAALDPVGDEDRPMTRDELRGFVAAEGVHIGNHTADHAILTNYDHAGVRDQIERAQSDLEGMTGARPCMISYPNGNYSRDVVQGALQCGLTLGVTVDARSSAVPQTEHDRMRLGRFCFTRGYDNDSTWVKFRAPTSLKRMASRWRGPAREG